MTTFLALTVLGLVLGCVYALTATGIVVTYTTSGVFNFAHGATGMVAAFAYWQLTVAWHWPVLVGLITLTPVPDGGRDSILWWFVDLFDRFPLTRWLDYSRLEFLANVAMFVPQKSTS